LVLFQKSSPAVSARFAIIWAALAMGCRRDPLPGDNAPGDTATAIGVATGETGPFVASSADTATPVDTGPWAFPVVTRDCDLVDVPSLHPGPVFNVSKRFIARIDGDETCHVHEAYVVGDSDLDGTVEFGVRCLVGYPGKGKLLLFDGHGRELLTPADATTALEFGGLSGAVTFAPISGLGVTDVIIHQLGGPWPLLVVPLPAPAGSYPASALAVADLYKVVPGGHPAVADFDADGLSDLVLTDAVPLGAFPDLFRGGVSIFRGPLLGGFDINDAWAWFEMSDLDAWSAPGFEEYSGDIDSPLTGDLDGNGRLDLLLGGLRMVDIAPNLGSYTDHHGGAALFLNVDSGGHEACDAQVIIYGTCYSYLGGNSVAVGDVTGDGMADLALGGARTSVPPYGDRGAIFIFSGLHQQQGYLSAAEADAILLGEGAYDQLYSVGNLGDLDRDGVDDLIVGAHSTSDGGRAYIFLGPVSGSLNVGDADLILVGGAEDARVGFEVKGVGDIDGDGIIDVEVGSQGSNWGGFNTGSAYFLSGADLLAAMK
jgi:hypothetical protein